MKEGIFRLQFFSFSIRMSTAQRLQQSAPVKHPNFYFPPKNFQETKTKGKHVFSFFSFYCTDQLIRPYNKEGISSTSEKFLTWHMKKAATHPTSVGVSQGAADVVMYAATRRLFHVDRLEMKSSSFQSREKKKNDWKKYHGIISWHFSSEMFNHDTMCYLPCSFFFFTPSS